MAVVYYSYYDKAGASVAEINRIEHDLGRRLLCRGLRERYPFVNAGEALAEVVAAEQTGKPFLRNHPEISFNITHCSGLAACAFHSLPVGVDAELVDSFPEVLINRALSEKEKGFLLSQSTSEHSRQELFWRFWTLKEAYVKRSGAGVDSDLTSVSFTFGEDFYPGRAGSVTVMCSDPDAACDQVLLGSGHVISVCYSSSSKNRVVYLPIS